MRFTDRGKDELMKLYTHLNFGGNCEEAFLFYEKHLGGKITAMMKQNQSPTQSKVPPGMEDAVIHARIDLAGVELIGNDVPPNYFQPIRSSYLYLTLDSAESADKTWNILAGGGEVTMPISETFFATRFGQLRDKFGVLWSIIHPKQI
jgi:PhnB protein